jgi:hypothetical protein
MNINKPKLKEIEEWAKNHPFPDRQLCISGVSNYTPRQILEKLNMQGDESDNLYKTIVPLINQTLGMHMGIDNEEIQVALEERVWKDLADLMSKKKLESPSEAIAYLLSLENPGNSY